MGLSTKKPQQEVDDSFFEAPKAIVDESFFSDEKKNPGGADLKNGTSNTSPSSSNSQLPSGGNDTSFGQYDIFNNPLNLKTPTVNVSGIPVKLNGSLQAPIPLQNNYNPQIQAKELQERIDSKTILPEDVDVIANSMQVSKKAAAAYLNGDIGTGSVIHLQEVKEKKQDELKALVDKSNQELGLNDNYDAALATPESAGAYIKKITGLYKNKENEESLSATLGAMKENPSLYAMGAINVNQTASRNSASAAQQLKNIITDDIIDKVSTDKTLTTDQKVKKIYQLSDATDYANTTQAIDKRLQPLRFGLDAVLGGNSTEDIDLLNSHKAGIEYKVNQKIKDQLDYNAALKSSFVEEYNAKVADGTIPPEDATAKKYYADRIKQIDTENAFIQNQYVPDKEIYKKYPVLQKAALANAVNEFTAIQSGNVKGYEDGGYEGVTLPEYLTAHGFDLKDQKVQDFLGGDNFKDYSWFGRPLTAAVDVFKSTAKSLGDITGLRDDVDLLSEKRQAEILPTQVGANDEFQLTEKAKLGQNIASTTGQVIGQGLLQAGTAGFGRMAGLSKLAAANAAFWSSGSLTSYDQAYKDSYDFIDSGVGRTAYAGLIALSNAASEKIFPDIKLFQIPGIKDEIAGLATRIGTKGFTQELADQATRKTMDKVKQTIVAYAKHAGTDIAKETVEEVTTQLFEDGLRFVSGDPNVNGASVVENVKNTAIQTATGMLAIGAYGAHKSVREERNTSPQGTVYNAALYHDEAHDAIQEGYKQGLYSEDDKNEKLKTLNTAQQANQTLTATEKSTGKELKRPQKELYVANLTAEALLTEQLKNNKDVLLEPSIKEKISNLQNQRQEILDGKVEIDEDGNITVPQKTTQNEKGSNQEAGNIQTNGEANAGSENGNDQAQQTGQALNSNSEAGQSSASVNEKIQQVELDRAADLEGITDPKKINEINSYYDTVASNLLTENLKQNATTITPKGQQQAESQQGGEQERPPIDGGQQSQASQQAEVTQSNSSDSNISSEEESAAIEEAKQLVNGGSVKGFEAEAFKNAANGDEATFREMLKNVSEQAQDPRSEDAALQTYGIELIEAANKLFPSFKNPTTAESVADKRARELRAKNQPNGNTGTAANQSVQPNATAEVQGEGQSGVQENSTAQSGTGSATATPVRPTRIRPTIVSNPIPERKPIPAKINTEADETKQSPQNENSQSGTAAGNTNTGDQAEKKTRKRVRGTRKANREIKHPEQLKALRHEVTSPVDHVLQYFIGGGKINASALEKIFGNKNGKNINGEVLRRVDLLNKDAESLSEVAHNIWEGLSQEDQDRYSSQDIENAVESVLTDFTSRTKMAEDLNKRFEQAGDEENPDQAYSDWLNQAYDTTGSEDAVDNAIDIVENLSDEEVQRIINQENDGQEAYANQLIAEHEETQKIISQQQQEKDKLGNQVDELKTYIDKLQREYDKQKAALAENGQQDQGNLFGGTKSEQMLFKNDLSEQRKIVDAIKQQLDNVKEFYNEAKEKFDKFAVGSMPLFSTKEDADDFETDDTRPVSVDLLQAAYPDATIVQSQSDLPADIQAQAEGKTVEGVLHNGEVFMVADNIANMGRAEGVYKHETIGHAGVIADLKSKLDKFASDLVNNATGGQRSAIDRLSQRLFKQASTKLTPEQKSTLGQEYIAQAAEKSDSFPTTWQKIVSFVRDFLRDRGITLAVTDKDIKVLLARAAKNVSSSSTGTRFSIAGEKANLDREVRENLNVARQMEKEGRTAEEIYNSTGWQRGAEKLWRYEIPDITLNMEKVGESGDLELKDMIQPGSELMKAYPELKNAIVTFVPNFNSDGAYSYKQYYFNEETGSYEEGKHIIQLNTRLLNNVPGLKSVLIHEIQHAIQRIEGFARGGSTQEMRTKNGVLVALASKVFGNWNNLTLEQKKKIKNAFEAANEKRIPQFYPLQIETDNIDKLEDAAGQLEVLHKLYPDFGADKLLDAVYYKIQEADGKDVAFEKYKKLAGEVEARNVQTRLNLSAEEKSKTPLSATEDVARAEQTKYYGDEIQQSVKDDDFARHMQEMLRAARESAQLPETMPEDLKNYADDIIDFLKAGKANITADEVIADMAQDSGTQFSPAEAPGLYEYVRSKFDADHQQEHQQNTQPGQAAPEPAAAPEDKSKLTDLDREIISKELEKKLSEVEFPNQFDMNEQLKQIAAKTQSAGQDRTALDGNYVQAHLEDLRQISLITAKSLETALGSKWKNKIVQFLEERPNAGNVAQVAGIMNVISTDVFNEIAKARSGNKISELQDLQARMDRLAYDNARSASLALNQRRLYQDFATGKPVSDILSEVILTPEQQQLKQAAEEALKQKFSDEELNKKQPKPRKPKAATTTKTQKPAPQPQSATVKDDLVAKGKANAQNSSLADKLQQAKDALNGFKC